jgi:hypothetical protein
MVLRACQSGLMAARTMPPQPRQDHEADKGRNPGHPDSRVVRALCFRRLLPEFGQNDGCRRLKQGKRPVPCLWAFSRLEPQSWRTAPADTIRRELRA